MGDTGHDVVMQPDAVVPRHRHAIPLFVYGAFHRGLSRRGRDSAVGKGAVTAFRQKRKCRHGFDRAGIFHRIRGEFRRNSP
jgi:hypothetical protein